MYILVCIRFRFHDRYCPVGWGCRIHKLPLCRGVRPLPTRVLDMTQNNFNGEVQVMLEFCGMWSTPDVPVLPGLLWHRIEGPDRNQSMG